MSFWQSLSFPNTRRFLQSSVGRMVPANVVDNFFLRTFSRRHIPMLAFVAPRIVTLDDDVCEICIPLRRATKNHLGSMYFAALAAGADLAGGLPAMQQIRSSGQPISLIFKDLHADFHKRAEGDVHFRCSDVAKIRRLVQRATTSAARVALPVTIDATVPSVDPSAVVASFKLTLSLKNKKFDDSEQKKGKPR